MVIPVWRDLAALEGLLAQLPPNRESEVIVAAATEEVGQYVDLAKAHPHVRLVHGPRGRATQMNGGAAAALGRWLLFLHADSHLPRGWRRVIREAEARAVVGGAFRFALDSRDWRARIVEAGARLRVSILELPYGDQGLFVRRSEFEHIGRYADMPLMEDVDLVQRLKRRGPLLFSPFEVTTSARRWTRDGWFFRSAENVALAVLFSCGVSPRWLAARYYGRKDVAIVVMARAPWTAGKTRLAGDAAPEEHSELRWALFLDTIDLVRAVEGVHHVVACEPADACVELGRVLDSGVDVIAQRGGDLGQRLSAVFDDVFRWGFRAVIVIGSDLPHLPLAVLDAAVSAVREHGDRIALGPAEDGGYYLVGLRDRHPELFERIDWGSPRVLGQTLSIAAAKGLEVRQLESWYDIDAWDDLERAAGEGPGPARTRDWLARYGEARQLSRPR